MQPHRTGELKKRVDEALEAGRVGAEASRELIDVLTPDVHEQTWPAVEVVLHVAEHPVIRAHMEDERLPEELETALVEAFSAVLPLLGVRAFGRLENFAGRTREALERERRKFEMVDARLDEMADEDREEAVALVQRYLGTEPAPLFVARLRRRRSGLVDEAESRREARADLKRLDADEELVEGLVSPGEAEPDALRAALEEALVRLADPARTLRRALAEGSEEQKLIAAALAALEDRTELAPRILEQVLAGSPYAPQMAVLAADLAPLMARNVFSQFLAEATWVGSDEPESEVTAERVHAILAARCVLPRAGSPLEEMTEKMLPASIDEERVRRVPAHIEATWSLWDDVTGRGD